MKFPVKKIISTVISSALLAVSFITLGLPSEAAVLCSSWSGEELNNGESTGGNTGGAEYIDREGGYRTLIHGVNTGVRPIKNFIADDIEPNGKDIYLRYRVRILSDDQSTNDDTAVFGFYPLIYGDGKLINSESADALIYTAKEVRDFQYDDSGWAYVYYRISEEHFSLSDYSSIRINNQVYYNGANNSGCAIDIAVAEIAVFVGNPEEGVDTEPKPPVTGGGESLVEDWTSVEIPQFPTSGTANLSGYAFATSDSYKDQGTIAVTAVDGDILNASRWIPNVSVKKDPASGLYVNSSRKTAWLQLEFEIPTTIESARIYWATERAAVGGYKLYASEDSKSWNPIEWKAFHRSEGSGSVQKPCVDTFLFDRITVRYVRLEISVGMTSGGLGSVYEFELYGDPEQYAYLSRKGSVSGSEKSLSDSEKNGLTPSGLAGSVSGTDGGSSRALALILSVLLISGIGGASLVALMRLQRGKRPAVAWTGALAVLLSGALLLTATSCQSSEHGKSDTTDSENLTAPDSSGTSNVGDVTEEPSVTSPDIPVMKEENVRSGWLLTDIPSYAGGKLSSECYNAGPGMVSDSVKTTAEDSYMQTISRTNASEFEEYLLKLETLGYQRVSKTELESNIHAEYVGGGRLIYAYYIHATRTARVIDDRSSIPVSQFGYSCASNGSASVYQYGLYQAGNTSTTMDCGMMYVIRQSDNSLIIIDGGHQYQATDEAARGFMDFLHEITGTTKEERITISGWFITHAHADHLMLAAKVLHRYHNEISLERVFFNFPSFQVVTSGYRAFPTTWFKHIVTTYYDNAVFMKPHTGMNFSLGDVNIQVLFTHEDGVEYSKASSCAISNFNSTSTVLKFTIDGQTFLLLGDADTEAEAYMLKMYKESATFESDLLQVAHHAFNWMKTLYPMISPSVVLVPNSYSNATSSGNLPKIQVLIDHCGSENVYYEGNGTYGFTVVGGHWALTYEGKLIGGEYDGSGF